MSSIDSFTMAFDGLRQVAESGRLSHSYLIVGSPRGEALALAESLLQLLFCINMEKPCGECQECLRIKQHQHPDVMWIEPESKSRKIDIDQIREELAPRISQTSYSGKWKAAVLLHAERMTDAAANAFLKTLEEPPGTSILLLLTDAPQFLLPTILSRCQRITLSANRVELPGEWREPLMEFLKVGPATSTVEAISRSALFKALLKKIEEDLAGQEEADEGEEDPKVQEARLRARLLEVRADLFRYILLWRRDVLMCRMGMEDSFLYFPEEKEELARQAAALSPAAALATVAQVEEMVRQVERNLPEDVVMEGGLLNPCGVIQGRASRSDFAIW